MHRRGRRRADRFWSSALGLELDLRGSDPARRAGAAPQHTVWVNPVPEAKSVKNRVHLDVNATSVEEIASLGATVLDDHSFRWTVMADPEDGELCVFVREGPVERRLYELSWTARSRTRSPPGGPACWIHLDVTTADVDALVTAGASVVRAEDDEIDWHVLADPEGNEFCAFLRS
ncbi:MAG TPA: VOC family protein [Nocardioidaceae bacterium]